MSDQEVKPTEAANAPIEDAAVKVADAEPETTKSDEPTKPDNASEPSDVKSEEEPAKEEPAKEDTAKEDTAKPVDDDKLKKARHAVHNPPEGMLRTGGRRRADEDYKKNIKFDPSTLPDTDDPNLIRTQVEFYFGDSNLPSDTHLWNKVGGQENNAVPLSDICSFKRMHRFKPYTAVVAALKDSKSLVIEGDEGSETVRRKHPYDPSKRQKVDERSTYVKGFGDEEPSTQFDIEAFFTRFGAINSVRLRRAEKGLFKGSVFVEWVDKETAEKFLALDPAPKWKDHPLVITSKQEYIQIKSEEIREGNQDPNNSSRKFHKGPQRGGNRGGRGRGRGNNHHGDSNDWKKRRDQDQKNGFGNRRGGGRDNRGRGRGRGSHGGGRGGRDREENGRATTTQKETVDERQSGRPTIKISNEGAKIVNEEKNGSAAAAAGKRAREDDGGAGGEPPAKKVDQKKEVAAADAA